MCSKNITQDFVILSRISSLLTNLEISWHYFRANIPQPYCQAIIMLITYVSWKNSMKPSCDNIHLPGESFIFYDISQVIAPLHTVSITVRTPVISEDSPLYYERDQAGDSHICTQLYWQRGLNTALTLHHQQVAGLWWEFDSLLHWSLTKIPLSVKLSCDFQQQRKITPHLSSLICLLLLYWENSTPISYLSINVFLNLALLIHTLRITCWYFTPKAIVIFQ